MKTIYLLRETLPDGSHHLVQTTPQKWHAIINEQKNLPIEQRRHFINDTIVENDDVDCIIIETTLEEWRKWDNNRKKQSRDREYKKKYIHLSLDFVIDAESGTTMLACSSVNNQMEEEIFQRYFFQEMHRDLAKWRPWATKMLEFYMAGDTTHANQEMMRVFGVEERTVRKYKMQFEEFLRAYMT